MWNSTRRRLPKTATFRQDPQAAEQTSLTTQRYIHWRAHDRYSNGQCTSSWAPIKASLHKITHSTVNFKPTETITKQNKIKKSWGKQTRRTPTQFKLAPQCATARNPRQFARQGYCKTYMGSSCTLICKSLVYGQQMTRPAHQAAAGVATGGSVVTWASAITPVASLSATGNGRQAGLGAVGRRRRRWAVRS